MSIVEPEPTSRIERVTQALGGAAVVAILVVLTYSVLGRWFPSQLPELNSLIVTCGLITSVIMSAGVALVHRSGPMIDVDIVYNTLPTRFQRVSDVVRVVATAVTAVLIATYAVPFAIDSWVAQEAAGGLTRIAVWPAKIWYAVCWVWAGWYCIKAVWSCLRHRRSAAPWDLYDGVSSIH